MPEYIIEFRQVGQVVKVSAIDPATGIEVSIPMPPKTPKEDMQRLAIRKLEYVLGKT